MSGQKNNTITIYFKFSFKSDCFFVAGHLPKKEQDYKRKLRPLAATYVTFSPDGNELLVNLGGEQVNNLASFFCI